MPCGLKSKKAKSKIKAIASLYPDGKNQIPKFSTKPKRNEPRIAPGTLPTPPMIAPVKPLIIKFVPIVGVIFCSNEIKIRNNYKKDTIECKSCNNIVKIVEFKEKIYLIK